jgi:L-amino acid N-acyltransferase YncA
MSATVRDATVADAEACAEIYAPFVTDTAVTFEVEPPSAEAFANRIDTALTTHAWLVVEDGSSGVLGYAYGGPYKTRSAYRWSCEVSVYVRPGHEGSGYGRLLYAALIDRLGARGYRTAVAGMTLPNPASVGLHTALGFEPIGTFRAIGWKLGSWHDVSWMQRPLGDGPAGASGSARPPEPR